MQTENKNILSFLSNGLFKKQSLSIYVVSLCSALFVTTSLQNAFIFSIVAFVILMLTTLINHYVLKLAETQTTKVIVTAVVSVSVVLIVKMLVEAFLPTFYTNVGTYIVLFAINILLVYKDLVGVTSSIKADVVLALKDAVYFGVALVVIALFREFFGTGSIQMGSTSLLESAKLSTYAIPTLVQPMGAFLIAGILFAVVAAIQNKKGAQK